MQPLAYEDDTLCMGGRALPGLAERFGTPLYVYSKECIEDRFRKLVATLRVHPKQIHYAVKANANLAVLQVLARLGGGFDVVSGGELERVLQAGGRASSVVFSGVGKTEAELHRALSIGVCAINVESLAELQRLAAVAREQGVVAPVSLRINPDVQAGDHPHISTGRKEHKFGLDTPGLHACYQWTSSMPELRLLGLSCHIGSQIMSIEPFLAAARKMLELADSLLLAGITIDHIDFGGGFGIPYRKGDEEFDLAGYSAQLRASIGDRPWTPMFEPGRFIVAPAGILLTRVIDTKESAGGHFTVVDAGMNDLLRPTLYDAWHEVLPVVKRPEPADLRTNVVGPICESGDYLAKSRSLSAAAGELLAICAAGAYGFVMSSNYNSRPRAAEVMIAAGEAHLVRKRENMAELLAAETMLASTAFASASPTAPSPGTTAEKTSVATSTSVDGKSPYPWDARRRAPGPPLVSV